MSARKAVHSATANHLTVEGQEVRLSLSPDSVVLSRSGIEFRSPVALSAWKEMVLTLHSPFGEGPIHCNGVVIACTGNRHSGYHVSMVFTGMSRQSQDRLDNIARSTSL
jgi:hypothetical protein